MYKILILAMFLILTAITSKANDTYSDVPEKLNALMDEVAKLDLFSGTVLVAHDEKIIFVKSCGYSDREKNILNSQDTKYNIGSIGKLFTAIMILQLASDNKINLNDNIGKYFTSFPQKTADLVNIKQLLTHSSGFGDFLQNPEFQINKGNYKEVSDLLKLISEEELSFAPGTGKRYSNSGFAILGGIIESVTGMSYEEVLNKNILQPLEMNSSGFIYWNEPDIKKSTGYLKSIKGEIYDNRDMKLQPSPAGGMYSTVEDMLKLDISLMNDNKLLSDKYKLILFNDFEEAPGVTVENLKSNPNSGNIYAGGAPGINAIYIQLPSAKYTALILSNYDKAAENLERSVMQILKGENYDLPKLPLKQFLYQTLEKEGIEYFSTNIESNIQSEGYKIENDNLLNNIAYQFLQNEMPEAAISVFELNAKLFPNIANVYDSLGEAYLASGNVSEAEKNFAKVLQIAPDNKNAKNMLEKIKLISK